MKPKKFNPAKTKRKLDRLFSQFILTKNNRTCEWCGKKGKCDTAHVIPREILRTRFLEINAVCLCPSCHKFGSHSFHKSPLHFIEWYLSKYGQERINTLIDHSHRKYEYKFTETEANSIEEYYTLKLKDFTKSASI